MRIYFDAYRRVGAITENRGRPTRHTTNKSTEAQQTCDGHEMYRKCPVILPQAKPQFTQQLYAIFIYIFCFRLCIIRYNGRGYSVGVFERNEVGTLTLHVM